MSPTRMKTLAGFVRGRHFFSEKLFIFFFFFFFFAENIWI